MKIIAFEDLARKRARVVSFEAHNDVEAAVLFAQLEKWRRVPLELEPWFEEVLALLDEEKSALHLARALGQNVTTINNRLAYLLRLGLVKRRKANCKGGGRVFLYARVEDA